MEKIIMMQAVVIKIGNTNFGVPPEVLIATSPNLITGVPKTHRHIQYKSLFTHENIRYSISQYSKILRG